MPVLNQALTTLNPMTQAIPNQPLADATLEDKYVDLQGVALMTGMQALVRLPLMLHAKGP